MPSERARTSVSRSWRHIVLLGNLHSVRGLIVAAPSETYLVWRAITSEGASWETAVTGVAAILIVAGLAWFIYDLFRENRMREQRLKEEVRQEFEGPLRDVEARLNRLAASRLDPIEPLDQAIRDDSNVLEIGRQMRLQEMREEINLREYLLDLRRQMD